MFCLQWRVAFKQSGKLHENIRLLWVAAQTLEQSGRRYCWVLSRCENASTTIYPQQTGTWLPAPAARNKGRVEWVQVLDPAHSQQWRNGPAYYTDLTFPAKVLKFALLVINCVKYFVPKYEFLCRAASSGLADKGVSVFRVSLWLHDLIATVACRGGGAKKVRVDVSIFLIVSWMMRKYRM